MLFLCPRFGNRGSQNAPIQIGVILSSVYMVRGCCAVVGSSTHERRNTKSYDVSPVTSLVDFSVLREVE